MSDEQDGWQEVSSHRQRRQHGSTTQQQQHQQRQKHNNSQKQRPQKRRPHRQPQDEDTASAQGGHNARQTRVSSSTGLKREDSRSYEDSITQVTRTDPQTVTQPLNQLAVQHDPSVHGSRQDRASTMAVSSSGTSLSYSNALQQEPSRLQQLTDSFVSPAHEAPPANSASDWPSLSTSNAHPSAAARNAFTSSASAIQQRQGPRQGSMSHSRHGGKPQPSEATLDLWQAVQRVSSAKDGKGATSAKKRQQRGVPLLSAQHAGAVAGPRPKTHNVASAPTQHNAKGELRSRNPLDKSAPSRLRGKEREKPRPKGETRMKKIIKEEKKQRAEKRNTSSQEAADDNDEINSEDSAGSSDTACRSEQASDTTEDHGPSNDVSVVGEPTAEAADGCDEQQAESYFEQPEEEASSAPTTVAKPPGLHSRKFRDYCTHLLDKELDGLVASFIATLLDFGKRAIEKDPVKAKMRRRLVFGLREARKYASLNKLRALIVAPDIERIESPGGLDDELGQILSLCRNAPRTVPVIFSADRRKLGRVSRRKGPISIVAVLNYDGAERQLREIIDKVTTLTQQYEEKAERLRGVSSST